MPKDVRSRLLAGERLSDEALDFVVVHRDADNAGSDARRSEIAAAVASLTSQPAYVPVIPVRMTEAWLLLDEAAIRLVAGNPRGRVDLVLPKPHEVESQPDPKRLLASTLLLAADVAGRRRERQSKRFGHHRRQLLERLDRTGPVCQLSSWRSLLEDIEAVASILTQSANPKRDL